MDDPLQLDALIWSLGTHGPLSRIQLRGMLKISHGPLSGPQKTDMGVGMVKLPKYVFLLPQDGCNGHMSHSLPYNSRGPLKGP